MKQRCTARSSQTEQIDVALALLEDVGFGRHRNVSTGGRSAEWWYAVAGGDL